MPLLCAVTDRSLIAGDTLEDRLDALERRLGALIAAGVNVVQLREKDLPDRVLLARARRLVSLAGGRARVLVNDRVDLALAAGADGVQVTTTSADVATIRRRLGSRLLLAASVHSPADARRAEEQGADLLVLGPIFETPSKREYGPPLGLDALRAVASAGRAPVLAIGGITLARLREVAAAGAAGVCAIRLFMQGPADLAALVAEARAAFDTPENGS